MATAVANRLHRSSAANYNCNYDLRTANIHKSKRESNKRAFYNTIDVDNHDSFSVCEGEPLYKIKKARTGSDNDRMIALLSSLNGFALTNRYDWGENKGITPEEKDKLMNKFHNDEIAKHEYLRDRVFSELTFMGFSATKWVHSRAGHQQQQFVATSGGTDTIYCDDYVEAGDVLVVDVPFPDDPDSINELLGSGARAVDPSPTAHQEYWKLLSCKEKRGVPRTKMTLVVRALPIRPTGLDSRKDEDAYTEFINGFYRRGQIVGRCTTGCSPGGRADVLYQSNAVGTWNCHKRY